VTLVGTATFPAVTENVPDVAPFGIIKDAGITASAGDAVNATVLPPLGAAAVSQTVQLDPAAGDTESGLQENPLSPAGCVMVTVLPSAEIGRKLPVASTPSVPET